MELLPKETGGSLSFFSSSQPYPFQCLGLGGPDQKMTNHLSSFPSM